jgi:hypothetical protein
MWGTRGINCGWTPRDLSAAEVSETITGAMGLDGGLNGPIRRQGRVYSR